VAATAAPTRAAAVLGALSSTGLLGVVPLAVAIAITRVRG
jgi:hypothetical protein